LKQDNNCPVVNPTMLSGATLGGIQADFKGSASDVAVTAVALALVESTL